MEWFSENDAKKNLLGKISATKREVIEAIEEVYDVNWSGIKYRDEAVADSLAVYYVAQKQSSTIKFLNR